MTKVLISGASVAGPALAYFLARDGYEVTVVERAPVVRDSGYAVDFRGSAFDVLSELGILDEMRSHETKMAGTVMLDPTGAEVAQLPAESFSGDLEVPKQQLTKALHRITADQVDYVFDDSIKSLTEHDSGVSVTFERGPAREFDLVFGADGVYSKVRELAFGPHSSALRHLGMSGCGFTTANFLRLDHSGLLLPSAGAAVYAFSSADPEVLTVSLSFATASPSLDRVGRPEQEQAVRAAFAGLGWEVPRLLAAMSESEDFYFGSTAQVCIDTWSRGRIALVGDAGYCAAPTSGMGTSQALLGARSITRQLAAHDDREAAFTAYEAELRPYVAENQAKGQEAAAMFGAE